MDCGERWTIVNVLKTKPLNWASERRELSCIRGGFPKASHGTIPRTTDRVRWALCMVCVHVCVHTHVEARGQPVSPPADTHIHIIWKWASFHYFSPILNGPLVTVVLWLPQMTLLEHNSPANQERKSCQSKRFPGSPSSWGKKTICQNIFNFSIVTSHSPLSASPSNISFQPRTFLWVPKVEGICKKQREQWS